MPYCEYIDVHSGCAQKCACEYKCKKYFTGGENTRQRQMVSIKELLENHQREYKIKTREQLMAEGYR